MNRFSYTFALLSHYVLITSSFSFRAGKGAKTMKDFVAPSGNSSPVKEKGGLTLSAVKSLVLGEQEDKLGFDSGDEKKLVSLINSLFNVGKFV